MGIDPDPGKRFHGFTAPRRNHVGRRSLTDWMMKTITATIRRAWTKPPRVAPDSDGRQHGMVAFFSGGLAGGFLDAVANGFHVIAEAAHGAATGGESHGKGGDKEEKDGKFEWCFHTAKLAARPTACHGVKPYLIVTSGSPQP